MSFPNWLSNLYMLAQAAEESPEQFDKRERDALRTWERQGRALLYVLDRRHGEGPGDAA